MVEHLSGMFKEGPGPHLLFTKQPTNRGKLLDSSGTWVPGNGKRKGISAHSISQLKLLARISEPWKLPQETGTKWKDYTFLRST